MTVHERILWLCIALFISLPGLAQESATAPSDEPAIEQSGEQTTEERNVLADRLERDVIQQALKHAREHTLSRLPGGVFQAPRIHRQMKRLLSRFQRTKFVDENAVFEIFLASTPEINGWVQQVQIDGVKAYHIVLTKGLIDAVENYAKQNQIHGSLAMLGGVLAHELGHAMHNDLEKGEVLASSGSIFEFDADYFGTELLAAAGYDPQAMVELLTMLGDLHKSKSLAALVARMLDEHPKASYRIAHIEPLISILRSPSTLQTGEQLSYEERYRVEEIDRRGPEKESRTSLGGFQKFVSSAEYQGLAYEEQVLALERFILFRPASNSDFMSRQLYVLIAQEYSVLLQKAQSLEQLNLLIASSQRFEEQVGGIASATADERKASVKRALRQLKTDITSRQLDMMNIDSLDFATVQQWSREVDYEIVMGALTRIVRKVDQPKDLIAILRFAEDYQASFPSRFLWSHSPDHEEYRDNAKFLYEATAVRFLHLTKDFEATLDFLQSSLPLQRTSQGAISNAAPYVLAGLVQYCLTHNDVTFGRFHERMDRPKTAEDRTFSDILEMFAGETAEVLFNRRGLGELPDPTSRTFSYNTGRRFMGFDDIHPDTVILLNRTLYNEAIDIIFNDLVKTLYRLPEAIDLLEQRPNTQFDWRSVRESLLQRIPSRSPRELQVQAKAISLALAELGIIDEAAHRDLARLSADAPHIVRDNFRRVHSRFLQSKGFMSGEDFQKHVPNPSQQWVLDFPMEERARYLEEIFYADVMDGFRAEGRQYLEMEPALREAMDLLMEEGDINERAAAEFVEGYRQLVPFVQDALDGNTDLPREFFELRRRSAMMAYLINLSDVLARKNLRALNQVFGLNRASAIHGHDLANRLAIFKKDQALSYLENPEVSEATETWFRGYGELAQVIARYEGIESLTENRELAAADMETILAQHIFDPAQSPIDKGTFVSKPSLYLDMVIDDRVKKMLRPLGPGFLQLLDERQQRDGNTLESRLLASRMDGLWSLRMKRAYTSQDPLEILVNTLGIIGSQWGHSSEDRMRTQYVLLTRALARVETPAQMAFFVSALASFLHGHELGLNNGMELLHADLKNLVDVTSTRYREHFYNNLIEALDRFQGWKGERNSLKLRSLNLKTRILMYLEHKAVHWELAGVTKPEERPLLLRMWILRNTLFPAMLESDGYRKFWEGIRHRLARHYTKVFIARGKDAGPLNIEEFYEDARQNTPWSEDLDRSIANYVRAGKFQGWNLTNRAKRTAALHLCEQIRSLKLRSATYDYILETYGDLKVSWLQKAKDYWELYRAHRQARTVWTDAVIEDLRQAQSIFESFKITEKAWEKHVAKRCKEMGINKADAYSRLHRLHYAKEALENPYGAEVSQVFPEGSRHRDGFLEKHAKKNPKTFEQLEMIEAFKSKNTATPYHRIAKAMFEYLDEYVSRLEPEEVARVALYLADFDRELEPSLREKMVKLFEGGANRRKALSGRGFHLSLEEIKTLFHETHQEEQALAFRALFTGRQGISQNPDAEALIIERVLFSDQQMPEYLRRVLNIYIRKLDRADRSILLSHLLAQTEGESLSGPQVLKTIVENGGAVAAKMAQLIASHGFNLPAEYSEVLEVFKGKAQKIDKIEAFRWIGERLPQDKFDQIETLVRELGSGSLKLAYEAKLKDGRTVVIKLGREYAHRKVIRELQLMRDIVLEVQQDAELRIDGLENIAGEVERIVLDEKDFAREFQLEKEHKEAHDERPWLIRFAGNQVRVYYPQPLEGWQHKGILVEEYVEADAWNKLPERAVIGWSKEKLAKAAINEVLNQIWSVLNPNERRHDGTIVLDIDPHEENQLAKTSPSGRKMVNIDLGQSVRVDPEALKGIASIIYHIDQKDMNQAGDLAVEFIDFRDRSDYHRLIELLHRNSLEHSDPVEVFTATLETLEVEGIALKPEYLFFQKLFATIVGLRKHIPDPNYISKQTKWIIGLRAISNPREVLKRLNEIREREAPPRISFQPSSCADAFGE